MIRITMVAIAAIIATPALAQHTNLDAPKPVKTINVTATTTLQQITGWPANHVTSLNRPHAEQINLPAEFPNGWVPGVINRNKANKIVLYYESGGNIDSHNQRFYKMAQQGGNLEIRSLCQSACTLVLYHFNRDHLCFGDDARLNFHLAANGDGTISLEWTRWMFNRMPLDIQAWIKKRGGAEKLPGPGEGYWTLPASELWKMGYHRCQ